MIKRFTLLLTALLVSVLFASMLGGSIAGAAVPSSAGVRWEAALKLQPEAAKLALLDRSTWTESMRLAGISAGLKDGWLSLQGQKDLTQLSTALFDTSSTWTDFLGGAVELTIHLPSDGKPVTLNLEARNTTGYTWEVLSGDYVQEGESTYAMRYRGVGVPSIQTIRLMATHTGDTSIHLLYHRMWETSTEPHAQVSIWMPGLVNAIDLSDPTPAVLTEKESSESGNNDAYAALDELKTVLPASFDWRTQGIVPAVRDQGNCGSCWAFGTVGVMESAVAKGGGPLIDLSEQFLISCNKDSWGCGGGLTATKYHYTTLGLNQTSAGAVLELTKPYIATKGACNVAYSHPYQATNWRFITGSEWTMPTNDQIKTAIYTYGPVTAGVCVDDGWYSYSSGVYIAPANACGGSTNHQIVLVGWDDATSTWILRNSWGPGWGESGYMHIRWDAAGTRSRVGEGTSWVRYTPPTPFNSNFNGIKTGWAAVKGTWDIYSNAYYYSTGLANTVASAKHVNFYNNFNYKASMKRTGVCVSCPNRLIVRGKPTSLTSVYDWKPSYLFQYTNDGRFSVFELSSAGVATTLKNWTTSAAIVENDWNELKVIANGQALRFYINGTLVWSGTDTTLTSGQVGLGFYRDASAGALYVDYAVLNPLALDENPFFNFEMVAPGIEQSGGSVDMAP